MRMSGTTHASRTLDEIAFTVVELVVALTLMMILVGSASTVLASSDTAQGQAKVRSKQVAVAESIFERISAGRDWANNPACADTPYSGCSAYLTSRFAGDPMLRDETSGLDLTAKIVATAVDSKSDELGVDDQDGVLPDYYSIRVSVDGTTAHPEITTVTTGGTVNPAARVSSGSIEVQMCTAFPQVDERIAVATCGTGDANSIQIAPPSNCTGTYDCAPFDAAKAADAGAFTQISLKPAAGVAFNVTGPWPSTSVAASGTTDSQGRATVTRLEPGQYGLSVPSPPSGYQSWKSHSVPGSAFATVEAGRRSDVLQAFEPVTGGSYRVFVTTRDTSDPWNEVDLPYSIRRLVFKLIPVPYGRVPFATEPSPSGWTVIEAGNGYGDVLQPRSGLYAMNVLRAPGGRVSPMEDGSGGPAPFLWIDQSGGSIGNQPATSRIRMSYCDPAKRQALIVQYCHQAGTCWYSIAGIRKFLGPCGGDTQLGGGALGAGGA